MDTPSEIKEVVLPQTVVGPLTRAAIFLVVCIRQDGDAYARPRAFCADLSGLIRAVVVLQKLFWPRKNQSQISPVSIVQLFNPRVSRMN
jgi:hypothetical protein